MNNFDDNVFKTFKISGHGLPGVWQYMLPKDFSWLKLPKEKRSDCDNCHKIIVEKYNPNCKCCTYFPQIPNFMLGLALKDLNTSKLTTRIIDVGNALPEGTCLAPSKLRSSLIEYSNGMFGKSRDFVCPFINTKTANCSIYPYRNSICATFYCENDHGYYGFKYWQAVQELIGQTEAAVCQWAMDKLGLNAKKYFDRLNNLAKDIDKLTDTATGTWSIFARKKLWDNWFGKELEFFEKCANLIIDHRDTLFEHACNQPALMAFEYEKAVEQSLCAKQKASLQPLAKNPGNAVSIGDLWYALQLKTRALWAIPFNENAIILNPDIIISSNLKNDDLSLIYNDYPFFVFIKGNESAKLFVSQKHYNALLLFKKPIIAGEKLLNEPEMAALKDSKSFIAKYLRNNFLILHDN